MKKIVFSIFSVLFVTCAMAVDVQFWDGFVMTTDGHALPDATMTVVDDTEFELVRKAVRLDDGRTVVAGLPVFEYDVRATVSAPGCEDLVVPVTDVDGKSLSEYKLTCSDASGEIIKVPDTTCKQGETLISGIVVNKNGTFIDGVQIFADGAEEALALTEVQDELRDPSYFSVCAPRDTQISFVHSTYQPVVLNSGDIKNSIIVMEKNK